MEENSEKIGKIWKKSKLKSEKIWEIWKESKLNSEKVGKIQKKRAYIHQQQDKQLGKIYLKQYYIGKGEITQGKQLRKINLEQDYIDNGEITQEKRHGNYERKIS